MYKTGTLNSEISKVLSDLGHTDTIVIADCGLPVPKGVQKIDLAVRQGLPSFIDVVDEMARHMVIEHVTLAEEIKDSNPAVLKEVDSIVKGIPNDFVTHEQFKTLTENSKVIIRTGEATPYANIILRSGVNF
ncbi:D-ribose pyranase [Macrococcoides caseolyticum]|uniref:D-ribose pyranase n=1 Tax=Macrococcoides caseolyticum TaxID=69966 RepID=UPI000A2923A6|nr:D-ribose pyranase [Macrococcus caseolyticus]ARQ03708.1 D-ribose pyranase [Macrococcus caseolyticus]PKE10052.1 D-ribose pyranase [Macrococcus caseolyticus]PKE46671.1 D-ribose pyranase [Macrococcus caseolyticus]PKF13204.1 D-ribose pyranase [Macrococcus caseolyticus]PNZ75038.1 D-ribose pyranase [Macrococcus caseolyticus]